MLRYPRLTSVSILLLASLFLLSGCGSSSKETAGEGAVTSGSAAAVQDSAADFAATAFTASVPTEATLLSGVHKAGATECANCHSTTGSTINAFTAVKKAAAGDPGWINGPHGNSNNAPSLAGLEASCKGCHDPLDDGSKIEGNFVKTGKDTLGTTNRPVVSCEACHGGGGNHFGVGPLPVEKPNALRCGRCHNEAMPAFHTASNPEGGSIFENFRASKHAVSINTSAYATGSTTDVQATCSRCHTDEGSKAYISVVNGTATHDEIKAALDTRETVKSASVVQCRTCHDKHNPDRLLNKRASGLLATWSAEFATCTSCHQLLKADGTLLSQAYHAPFDTAGTVVNSIGSASQIISDTHYDDPNTPQRDAGRNLIAGTGGIEGYIINPAGTHNTSAGNTNQGICRDCHNPHDTDNNINKQWARSAHGGFILTAKEQAAAADPKTLYSAGAQEATAPGWVHYNWRDTNRQACQRCHTSTGFRNYANDPANYNAANNVFPAASGEQNEMLYCWGCHTDNMGTMRNPGAITANYTDNLQPFVFPDLAASNVCMACHTGRENGESIKKKTVTSNFDFGSKGSFVNSHYLTAGGTVFTVTGYEFTGLDYANPAAYLHDKIGTSSGLGTGSNGPCVGCHMSASERHLFLPVAKNETTGVITSVTATVCTTCHGTAMTATALEEEKESHESALTALKAALEVRGYFFANSHPYFFKDTNANGVLDTSEITSGNAVKDWRTPGDTDNTGATTGKNNMGAAFNYNLLVHDPGAYAHNRFYAKRLIYDSLDWLDDNVVNGSVTTAINNLAALSAAQKSAALAHLNSGTRP